MNFYPGVFTKGFTNGYEPVELDLINDSGEDTFTFRGRMIGQSIDIQDQDPTDFSGDLVGIYEREGGGFVSYLAHFSRKKGIWEANHTVTDTLDFGKIREGLLLEVNVIGNEEEEEVFSNLPVGTFVEAYHRAVGNYEIIQEEGL